MSGTRSHLVSIPVWRRGQAGPDLFSVRTIGGRELPEVTTDVTLEHRANRSETQEPPDHTSPHGQLALVCDRCSTLASGSARTVSSQRWNGL